MSGGPSPRPPVPAWLAAAALVAVALTACGGDDDPVEAAPPSSTGAADPTSSTSANDPGCGVALEDVQALLPPSSGVTENAAPDDGRCNFTWDDGGSRGIDVATVSGGRTSTEVPAGLEPIDGYGEEAFGSFNADRASCIAFAGDDLYAVDVTAPGTGATEGELRDLCLQLLDRALG